MAYNVDPDQTAPTCMFGNNGEGCFCLFFTKKAVLWPFLVDVN